jgi:hypothetical protein
LTSEERKRHIEERLCFKCHKKGHRLFQCPDLKGKAAMGARSKSNNGGKAVLLTNWTSRLHLLETLLATEVFETPSTSPSTKVATHATLVAGRRRPNKQRHSRKPVTIRSIDWKLVDSVFEPLHARFDFTLEGCANGEGLNSAETYLIVRRVTRF